MNYPTITPRQAKAIANKRITIEGKTYRIGSRPRMGGEAFVYPLYNNNKTLVAYLRFLTDAAATPYRIERTSWLIGQQLDELSPVFRGAPRSWFSTKQQGRIEGVQFDFCATLHHAVRGDSWRDVKAKTEYEANVLPSPSIRLQLARNFIAQLATLETIGPEVFVHGDVSDGNLIVNVLTGECALIDFDAFVFKASDTLKVPQLCISDGGVKGTSGYMPRVLEEATAGNAHPFSDRFGRDMLLIELLAFQEGDPVDLSPSFWTEPELTERTLRPMVRELGIPYLLDKNIYTCSESDRPSSRELAIAVNCAMPRVSSGSNLLRSKRIKTRSCLCKMLRRGAAGALATFIHWIKS